MKKKIVIGLYFLAVVSSLFSLSGKGEYFEIVNNRKEEITVERRYWFEEEKSPRRETICGIDVNVCHYSYRKNQLVVEPSATSNVVDIFPTASPFYKDSEGKTMIKRLGEISFVEKLKEIYKELNFYAADGMVLASLDTLKNSDFSIEVIKGGPIYILVFE